MIRTYTNIKLLHIAHVWHYSIPSVEHWSCSGPFRLLSKINNHLDCQSLTVDCSSSDHALACNKVKMYKYFTKIFTYLKHSKYYLMYIVNILKQPVGPGVPQTFSLCQHCMCCKALQYYSSETSHSYACNLKRC